MPKKKTTKTKNLKATKKKSSSRGANVKKIETKEIKNDFISSVSSQLRLKESYASLFLGIVVVVVAIVLGMIILGGKGYVSNPNLNQTAATPSPFSEMNARTYTVQEGEGLFEIAEKIYGNGDYWIKIVEANNIQNPDYVEAGTKLVIPEIK